MAKTKAHSST